MSAQALVTDLRQHGVALDTDGDRLSIDAPAGVVDQDLRALLTKSKQVIIKLLEWERRKHREADPCGLVIEWAEERGWIALHDSTTGQWHEVKAADCLPSVVKAANSQRCSGKGDRT